MLWSKKFPWKDGKKRKRRRTDWDLSGAPLLIALEESMAQTVPGRDVGELLVLRHQLLHRLQDHAQTQVVERQRRHPVPCYVLARRLLILRTASRILYMGHNCLFKQSSQQRTILAETDGEVFEHYTKYWWINIDKNHTRLARRDLGTNSWWPRISNVQLRIRDGFIGSSKAENSQISRPSVCTFKESLPNLCTTIATNYDCGIDKICKK